MEVNDFHAIDWAAGLLPCFQWREGRAGVFARGNKTTGFPVRPISLPSMSPANAAVSYSAKLEAWRVGLDVG
jgi:hypothetical protein